MRLLPLLSGSLGALALAASAWTESTSAAPPLDAGRLVRAADAPIDVDIGHAAPGWTDWDGDGLADLLVGQFGDGKLRIYRNVGKAADPAFREHAWFEAGGEIGKVPSG